MNWHGENGRVAKLSEDVVTAANTLELPTMLH